MTSTETDINAAHRALGGVGDAPVTRDELVVRLQVLRSWIHQVDWDALVRAHPPAAKWFDEDGLPND
jgi:hypothetical protein